MLELCIRCPKCNKYHYYSLGDDKTHRIGDIVGPDYKYYSQSFNAKCYSCREEFSVVELVSRGQVVNILINPTDEEQEKIEDRRFKCLDEYPDKNYGYYRRQSMMLGEETCIIPSQYFFLDLKIGEEIPIFKGNWIVKERYKTIDNKGQLVDRIYKVMWGKEERLLILGDNLLPTLKLVDWNVKRFANDEERFKKYRVPPNCKLLMDLT